jgi:hypothetical protein
VYKPGQGAHRRRLAGAVGSEEAVHHARRDRKVETVERAPRSVTLAQAARRQGQTTGATQAGPPWTFRTRLVAGAVPESC